MRKRKYSSHSGSRRPREKKSDSLDKELRDQYAREDANNNIRLHDAGTKSKRHRLENVRKEESDTLRNEIIDDDSHFNFPKVH